MKIKNKLKYIVILLLFNCDPESEEGTKQNASSVFDINPGVYTEHRQMILENIDTIKKQCKITDLGDYNEVRDMIDLFFGTEFKNKCSNHEDVDNILVLSPNMNGLKENIMVLFNQKEIHQFDDKLKSCGELFFKKLKEFLKNQQTKIAKAEGRMIGQDNEIQSIFYESFKQIIEILVDKILLKQCINREIHDSLINWQKSDKKKNPLPLIKTIIQ